MIDSELWLVRHGETEWSRSGRHTSVTDLPLTERGAERAAGLRELLEVDDFDLVLSSPRQRALRTAEIAGFGGPHAPEVAEELAEWWYGDYEGLTSPQIHQTVPGWTIWTHGAPGGETAGQVAARLDRVVARVRTSNARRAICFGHGHALRALMLRWLGLDLTLGGHFPLQTGAVGVLGNDRGTPALDRWNLGPMA